MPTNSSSIEKLDICLQTVQNKFFSVTTNRRVEIEQKIERNPGLIEEKRLKLLVLSYFLLMVLEFFINF